MQWTMITLSLEEEMEIFCGEMESRAWAFPESDPSFQVLGASFVPLLALRVAGLSRVERQQQLRNITCSSKWCEFCNSLTT